MRALQDTPAIAELRDAKVVADANAESARVRVGETNAAVTAADAALGSGVGGEAAVDAAFAAKEDATQRLAEAERMAHAADAALVAAIAEEVEMGAEIRRAARVEAIKPSRSSARAASRPKKTYLEDDVFGEDEIRAAALGAAFGFGLRSSITMSNGGSKRSRDRRPALRKCVAQLAQVVLRC